MMNYATTYQANWLPVILRAIEVWLVIAVVEVIHGIARVAFLQPLIGDFPARRIAVFSGSLLILAVALLFRRWLEAASRVDYLLVGWVWVALTIGFEVLIGRLVLGLSWERIFSDYDVLNGGLMPLGLLVMFFAPLIVSRFNR